MKLLIDLYDIAEELDISENMEESVINKRIKEAQRFDLIPLLPAAFWTDLHTTVLEQRDLWNSDDDYSEDDIVYLEEEDGTFSRWICVADNSDSKPSADNSDWELSIIFVLWELYLKQYLIRKSYDRFLTWHGRNVAQDDIVQIRDENRTAVTDKGRAEMKNDIRNQGEVFFQDFLKYIDTNGTTVDGTNYLFGQSNESSLDDGIILHAL